MKAQGVIKKRNVIGPLIYSMSQHSESKWSVDEVTFNSGSPEHQTHRDRDSWYESTSSSSSSSDNESEMWSLTDKSSSCSSHEGEESEIEISDDSEYEDTSPLKQELSIQTNEDPLSVTRFDSACLVKRKLLNDDTKEQILDHGVEGFVGLVKRLHQCWEVVACLNDVDEERESNMLSPLKR